MPRRKPYSRRKLLIHSLIAWLIFGVFCLPLGLFKALFEKGSGESGISTPLPIDNWSWFWAAIVLLFYIAALLVLIYQWKKLPRN